MNVNVYFVSGLSANCDVFDKLDLPEGYNKNYIEWYIPHIDETLEEYAANMAVNIDKTQPFILVGYSFGGIIIQEMNKFVNPLKNIIIASIKHESEIPPLFKFGQKIKFAQRFPLWSMVDNKRIKELFAYFIYRVKDIEILKYVSYTDPIYMQWSIYQIFNWKPTITCKNIFHIHGTRDQTFPAKYITDAQFVEGGDHFMVFKRSKKLNAVLNDILLNRTEQVAN